MHVCVQLRKLLGVQSKVALLFEFTLTYEQDLAYWKLTGHTVRKSYWKDLTIKTPPFQKGGRNGGVFECIVRNCCALAM